MLGQNLRMVRKERKITQDEISSFLGVKRQTYSAYERGISVPDSLTLKKLADYFDVSTDYLFGGDGSQRNGAKNLEEQKILLLARRAEKIPEPQRERIIQGFADNIDLYLEAMNMGKEQDS